MIASVSTLSNSEVSEPWLSPSMCRVRFFRNAVFSLLGTVSPSGKSQGFRVSRPSRSTLITRPPMSSMSGSYESPRSRIETSGRARAIINSLSCARKVFPPPLLAMINMLASPRPESNGENGMSCR